MMADTKEICKEVTRYFIGYVDDPRLDLRADGSLQSNKVKCEKWLKELDGRGVYGDKPTRVYTVKITLIDD